MQEKPLGGRTGAWLLDSSPSLHSTTSAGTCAISSSFPRGSSEVFGLYLDVSWAVSWSQTVRHGRVLGPPGPLRRGPRGHQWDPLAWIGGNWARSAYLCPEGTFLGANHCCCVCRCALWGHCSVMLPRWGVFLINQTKAATKPCHCHPIPVGSCLK